jgi:V8-like Glu-specific endopeptidase
MYQIELHSTDKDTFIHTCIKFGNSFTRIASTKPCSPCIHNMYPKNSIKLTIHLFYETTKYKYLQYSFYVPTRSPIQMQALRLLISVSLEPLLSNAKLLKRIVGGQTPGNNAFASHVNLKGPVGHCSGTLIAPDKVLSAAHCYGGGDGYTAQGLGPNGVEQQVDVRRVSVNPGYQKAKDSTGWTPPHDQAVFHLSKPFQNKPVAKLDFDQAKQGDSITQVGTGATQFGPFDPNKNRHSYSNIADTKVNTLNSRLSNDCGPGLYCAPANMQHANNAGDSGGGAYRQGSQTLIGSVTGNLRDNNNNIGRDMVAPLNGHNAQFIQQALDSNTRIKRV